MELTEKLNCWEQTFDAENLLHRITTRIRQARELEDILAVAADEVRSFLAMERVMVYRFDSDESGEVIAESIHEQRLPSLLGLHFPTEDIPQGVRNMFLWARQRSIVDVASGIIGLSQLASPETGKSLGSENIYYREVDPCHIEYLKAMGVQSSLVVPILHYSLTEPSAKPQLWGLLVSHHSKPRTVLHQEVQVVQRVVDVVSMAIAQNHLQNVIREQQQREAIVNKIISLLHPPSTDTNQLQAALEATTDAFGGVGGRLYLEKSSEVYATGEQPLRIEALENTILEEHRSFQDWIAQCQKDNIIQVGDLHQEPYWRVLAPAFQSTHIRGVLAIPLNYDGRYIGILSIFRSELETKILWGGWRGGEARNQLPQISFETWLERKKEQPPEWKPEDIALGQALATQFSIAIQQQQMYQQVQTLNAKQEHQVQERTAELQKSLEQTLLIKQVTEQMRSNLDYNITLQTIVEEVRRLLKTDRVLVYKLLSEGGGEVIVEDVDKNWSSVLGHKMPQECFPDEYARLYFRGRVRAINNTAVASLDTCHREFLHSLQIKANVIVPINIGTQLWGLLIAHQCYAPRNWEDAEIDLLQQLADAAAVAIQQAQLYERSRAAESTARSQAEKMVQLLHEIQQTQAKLIQSQKISSFGLLSLGATQEINNSVNFISTQLSQASEYTQNLLELLHLYQLYNPYPDSEITHQAEVLNLDSIAENLPRIMSSIKVQVDRVRSTVQSLQNFSSLERVPIKPVDINKAIERVLSILQHRLQLKIKTPGIEVIKNYGNLPMVECYAAQINQVFINLISYAIDALTNQIKETRHDKRLPTGELEVSSGRLAAIEKWGEQENSNSTSPYRIQISTGMSSDSSHAIVRIAYNDSGMTQDIKSSIFDPACTTQLLEQSIGMELSMSYLIVVQKHGGALKCVSEPGKGTEFWIEIPLKQSYSL